MKLAVSLFIILWAFHGFSQTTIKSKQRVDLDDVKIKGESNKGNFNFSNRTRHSLNDRIKLRKDFNSEVLENLPAEFKKSK